MGSRIAENAQGIQRRDCLFGFWGIVHALRLVYNDDGAGVLYIPHGGFAVQLVLRLIYDIFGFFECVDIDNHNLNIRA